MLQGIVVYVDDLMVVILLSILNIVEKYYMFPKFHLLKPNGAGSLFHGILVFVYYCAQVIYLCDKFIVPHK